MDQPELPVSPAEKLQKTRELIYEEEARRLRQELEQILQFERDSFRQAITESELRYEQRLNELNGQIDLLKKQVEELEIQVVKAKEVTIDAEKLAVILSDLSLQLMSVKNKR